MSAPMILVLVAVWAILAYAVVKMSGMNGPDED